MNRRKTNRDKRRRAMKKNEKAIQEEESKV